MGSMYSKGPKGEYMVLLILIHWNTDETKRDILWYKSEYILNIYHKFSKPLWALWYYTVMWWVVFCYRTLANL